MEARAAQTHARHVRAAGIHRRRAHAHRRRGVRGHDPIGAVARGRRGGGEGGRGRQRDRATDVRLWRRRLDVPKVLATV